MAAKRLCLDAPAARGGEASFPLPAGFTPSPTRECTPEQQYLDLVRRVLDTGSVRADRTGVGTRSVFGATLRFDLSNYAMPLLTTKRMYWRGIVAELLWFISGSTDARVLGDQGVHIWDAQAADRFKAKGGILGDLGPVYGFQWRFAGARYVDCATSYKGQGVDQLALVMAQVRHCPASRRIVMSAWNPLDLGAMALPPCHMMCQFYVSEGTLSCQMYQRSADVGLGLPFNIASYALLTHLIAECSGLKAAELIISIGDAHVYLNHVEALRTQLERAPLPFPTLKLDCRHGDIELVTAAEIELRDYAAHESIKMDMAV